MAIRAVLFDLDSTLWHVEGPFDWEWLTALQSAEIEPEFARLEFRHLDAADFVRRFWANFREDDSLPDARLEEIRGSAVVRKTLAQFGADCQDYDGECVWDALNNVPFQCFNIRPFPDAFSTLETLRSSGLRLAIVNNRPLKATIVSRELRGQGFPDVFEAVVTSGDVGFRKPHPLVFETALARLGVSSREAVVVGDSYKNDIVPAAKLGIVPVLKLNDREPDPSWLLARYQVRHLRELLELEPFAGSANEGHGGRRSP